MNPSSPESQSATAMNLPAPVNEQPANQFGQQPNAEPAPQQPNPGTASPGFQLPAMPQAPPPASVTAQDAASIATPAAQAGLPSTADDQDLIEKEWVNKAKQIVEKTRNDPYEQTKELTMFKSDYMQKRYNKTIKLGD